MESLTVWFAQEGFGDKRALIDNSTSIKKALAILMSEECEHKAKSLNEQGTEWRVDVQNDADYIDFLTRIA